jgi:ribosomal protein L29
VDARNKPLRELTDEELTAIILEARGELEGDPEKFN